jgi:hypothetical protein
MDGKPEDDENGPETDSDGKGKAHVRGGTPRAGGSHWGAAHAVVPSSLRGARAGKARGKIRETLTDASFESHPVENHFNRR